LNLASAASLAKSARMAGRFFDEWQVGDTVAHAITRTITEADNLLISTLTHNPQPLHLDAEAAKASEFGQILVNSCLTFSLVVGVSVADTTLGTLVANLGFDEVRLPKPVFIGDTLRFESECVELKESKSRPNAGIVTWEHRAINQRGETVCTMKRTAMIQRKAA
jgi:acyl dehydratase